MADEELELFEKQLYAALRTFRQATRRMSKMTRRGVYKNEFYDKLLQLSIDTDKEIIARKEQTNQKASAIGTL